jgi:hypothetical protein
MKYTEVCTKNKSLKVHGSKFWGTLFSDTPPSMSEIFGPWKKKTSEFSYASNILPYPVKFFEWDPGPP